VVINTGQIVKAPSIQCSEKILLPRLGTYIRFCLGLKHYFGKALNEGLNIVGNCSNCVCHIKAVKTVSPFI